MKSHRSFLHIIKRGIGPVLLAAVTLLAAGALSVPASAAASSVTAVIPVQQTIKNGSGTFSYTLTPEDKQAPMPEGTADGAYHFSLKDTASGEISVSSTQPGTWYYTLAVEKQDGFEYGTTKYRLGIQYVNDGGTLKANINALADGAAADRKAAKVDFKITAGAKKRQLRRAQQEPRHRLHLHLPPEKAL